jgi:malonyl-CoA O-methyltransferase
MLRTARAYWRRRRPLELPARELFDRLGPSYDRIDNPLLALERPALSALLPPPGTVGIAADLGGGTGYWARRLLDRGARTAVVVDLARAMLTSGAQRFGLGRAQGDLARLPLRDGAIELAICSCCLGYVAELTAAIGECARILRPGGLLLLSDYHPAGLKPGWRRSFRHRSRELVAPTYLHAPEQVTAAAGPVGLECLRLEIVRVDRSLARFGRERRGLEPLEAILGLPALYVASFKRIEKAA